jgi:hypothetical protein
MPNIKKTCEVCGAEAGTCEYFSPTNKYIDMVEKWVCQTHRKIFTVEEMQRKTL